MLEGSVPVEKALAKIPPQWGLREFVAVNPFGGLVERTLEEASRDVARRLKGQILPELSWYRARLSGTANARELLRTAARRTGNDPALLARIALEGEEPASETLDVFLTAAEIHDRKHRGAWSDRLNRHDADLCGRWARRVEVPWGLPEDAGLWQAWKLWNGTDASMELYGLKGWCDRADSLPQDAWSALQLLSTRSGLDSIALEAWYGRLLGGIAGWASWLRREGWQAGNPRAGSLVDLLAMRVASDLAVVELLDDTSRPGGTSSLVSCEPFGVRRALQEALEDDYFHRLIESIEAPPHEVPLARPSAQAVFCIDVRSEVFRRHLETVDPTVQTRGMAGFFGLAIDWTDTDAPGPRCPVLLGPSVSVGPTGAILSSSVDHLESRLPSAAVSAFSWVETLGLAYGLRLCRDALSPAPMEDRCEHHVDLDLDPTRDPESSADLAAGILRAADLDPALLAPLVLLCGHGSRSANNAHAAGLDCGACGGHAGGLNARVGAALLNHSDVRDRLASRGIRLPADTVFLAGLHDTSVDEIRILDRDAHSETTRTAVASLERSLARAGELSRKERAAALGESEPSGSLRKRLDRRVLDGAITRPEWALAGNAAFLVARRDRSRLANLGGRVFLHEYDVAKDAQGDLLAAILGGPMVVGSWINLQYFASTVDHERFGAGTKILHNRVGSHGVVSGNGGDLMTGLSWQSVVRSDGTWQHEPLRLQVIVEATPDQVDAVLSRLPTANSLVENGWVRLFALDPEHPTWWRRLGQKRWVPEDGD